MIPDDEAYVLIPKLLLFNMLSRYNSQLSRDIKSKIILFSGKIAYFIGIDNKTKIQPLNLG